VGQFSLRQVIFCANRTAYLSKKWGSMRLKWPPQIVRLFGSRSVE
jgi:hypothetical protein